MLPKIFGIFGIFALLGIAWLLSNNKKKIDFRIILWGIGLQLVFAILILKTGPGQA
ncbi:MAG: Na+ dependent nucleoside transporter N-terminal domain-containing protein, partial [bacterium]|nr:Na+ dependent nucleoside transporter N-terminal domain-containing protein [bacterium]